MNGFWKACVWSVESFLTLSPVSGFEDTGLSVELEGVGWGGRLHEVTPVKIWNHLPKEFIEALEPEL